MFGKFFERYTYIKTGTIALLLSITGSGLYDLIKPLAGNGYILLLNISTLGLTKLQDGLYVEAAKGFHESASLKSFVFVNGFLIGLSVSCLVLVKRLRKRITNREMEPSLHQSWSYHLVKNKYFLAGIFMYFIFGACMFMLDLVKESYVNRVITYHTQILTIARPYMTEREF